MKSRKVFFVAQLSIPPSATGRSHIQCLFLPLSLVVWQANGLFKHSAVGFRFRRMFISERLQQNVLTFYDFLPSLLEITAVSCSVMSIDYNRLY